MRIPRFAGLAFLSVLALSACDSDENRSLRTATPSLKENNGGSPVFREIAKEVGLEFYHFTGATGGYALPEIMGAGGALLDYDNDGDLDVLLLQGGLLDPGKSIDESLFPPPSGWPGHRLFRNELVPTGRLRFVDRSAPAGLDNPGYGMGVAAGDIDNDGDLDLYLTGYGPNALYRNDGDGEFTDITEASGTGDRRWSTSASFFDYDRDGDLDLFVVNYVDSRIGVARRCTNATGQRDYCSPNVFKPVSDRLFRNEGAGKFTDVSRETGIGSAPGPGLGVTSADFNQDGWIDLYVANDQQGNRLWLNQGGGRFEDAGLMSGSAYNADGRAEASMGVAAGDFDNDGDEDLFMTHMVAETNTLFQNDGAGVFYDLTSQYNLEAPSMMSTGFATEWFDFDNDGSLDLFVANGAVMIEPALVGKSSYPYQQKNQLFKNAPGGRFTDVSRQAGPAFELLEVSRGAAFGDIDNDGDIDILVTNNNGPVRLLRNEVGNRNHWLLVQLTGAASSLGARVAVLRPEKPPLWRRAHTDGSYLSASDRRVHFGLGRSTDIEAVLVHWPSGREEVWREVAADSVIKLQEGKGEPLP